MLDLPETADGHRKWRLHCHRFEQQFAIAASEFPVEQLELLPVSVAIQPGHLLHAVILLGGK